MNPCEGGPSGPEVDTQTGLPYETSAGAERNALRFEARIFPGEVWPVEILEMVELSLFKCARLDHAHRSLIWVRGNHLFILPNAPERSAS